MAAPAVPAASDLASGAATRNAVKGLAPVPAQAPLTTAPNSAAPNLKSGGLLPRFPNPNPGPWSGCEGTPPIGRAVPMCELK